VTPPARARDLLAADAALGLGLAGAEAVAAALQARWNGAADSLGNALGLGDDARQLLEDEVARLVATAGGDADAALRRRGGLDRAIHETIAPERSRALLAEGVGARAPLRRIDTERYRDFSLIGKGGMGVVYLALDTELNRRVALKIVRPDPGGPADGETPASPLSAAPPPAGAATARPFAEARTRFLQEVWITGAMEHPGVLPVYEVGETGAGIPYFTMRYVRGERTLKEALAGAREMEARLGLVEPFLRVCDTLDYAHARGVVHRDLKPENIALGSFGEVLVIDWGLSRSQGQPDVTQSHFSARLAEYRAATNLQTVAGVLGTPGYMAPEAAIGKAGEVDARSDVYSLGAMLFQILTGRLPHEFETFVEFVARVTRDDPPRATELEPAVPDALADACARALARDKADRFATAGELATAVRHWQTEGRVDAKVDELVELARTEIARATELGGNVGLWHLDRATAACTRALALRPEHPEAVALSAEARRTRDSGIRARITTGRRRVLAVAAVVVLGAAAVVALAIARKLADERERAERAHSEVAGRVVAADVARRRAEPDRDRALARLAGGFAATSRALLGDGRVAAAQLAAARGLDVAATPETWNAAARADARWSPAPHAVLPDVAAGAIAFAPDARTLFLARADRRVVALPLAAGAPAREPVELGRVTGRATAIAVSAGGARLAIGQDDGLLRVWDVRTGEQVAALPGGLADPDSGADGTAIDALLFLDDRTVVGAYGDRMQRVWDLDAKSTRTMLGTAGLRVGLLVRDPGDQTRFWSGTVGGDIAQWSAGGRGGPRKVRAHVVSTGRVAALLPAPDGFFAVGLDHRAVFVDFARDTELSVFAADAPGATALAVRARAQPSGTGPALDQVVSSAVDGALRIWDVPGKRLRARFDAGSPAGAMALHEEAGLLATAHEDRTVRLWSLGGGAASGPVPGSGGSGGSGGLEADAIVLQPGRRRLVVARRDESIAVHDLTTGAVAPLPPAAPDGPVSCLAATPDGTAVAGSLDGSIRVLDERGAVLRGPDPVTALACVDGERLFAGDVAGRLREWSVRRRASRSLGDGDGFPVTALAVAPGGERLVSGDVRGRVRLWDAARGEVLEERAFPGTVTAVALSPDGRRVAAAGGDGRIRTWTAGEPEAVLAAKQPFVARLEFVDDGRVRFWNAALQAFAWRPGAGAGPDGELDHAPAFARPPRPWAQRDTRRRLVAAENRYRMRMDGFTPRLVPPAEATPDVARVTPWSR